jgi:Cu-Zn family superoxide dismutase
MRGIERIIGSVAGMLLAGAALTVGAAGPGAAGQLVDRAGAPVGRVALAPDGAGVRITVEASGLTPGAHGIHLHAVGRCEGPAFASAGGHFNPAGKKHGLHNPEGAHGGDLPNLTAGADGAARYATTTHLIALDAGPIGIFDADGAALVIHAMPDDETTDPAGNSGDRVACAVLAATPAMPGTGLGGPDGPAMLLVALPGALIAMVLAALRRRRRL